MLFRRSSFKAIPRWVIVAALITLQLPLGANLKAEAVGTGALRIVASGGASVGTGWTFSGGLLELSSDSSINASDIVGYLSSDLIIEATSISVESSVVGTTSSDITFRATANINILGGVQVATQGGDITFHANSDNSGTGSIRLGSHNDTNTGSLISNGGNIFFGGGTNLVSDFAVSSSDVSPAPNQKPTSGVAIYGFSIQAGGGNITVRGSGGTSSLSTRAVLFENNAAASPNGRTVLQTSGSGTININGDASGITHSTPWGPTFFGATFITGSGDINVVGRGNTGAVGNTNARGFASSNVTYQSTSGNINLTDTTNGSSNKYTGVYFGGPNTFETTGNVNITADKIVSQTTFTMSATNVNIYSNTTESFLATPAFDVIAASNVTNSFNIGRANNSSALTFETGKTVASGAPITLHGAAITIKATITATGQPLTINASGAVTQTAAISVGSLALNGVGPFTLANASNSIGTLAGGTNSSPIGAVNILDSLGSLIIGQVGSYSGLYSTGIIEVATSVGDISVTHPVSSTATSTDSLKLFANKPTASGTAGTGNVTFSGTGATSIAGSSRALLYSGSRTSSTGTVTEVGGVDNARTSVDATTNLSTGVTPALNATGKFVLFRVIESQVITFGLPADKIVGETFASAATADSGLAVSLASSTTGVCTVSGLNITTVAVGTCTIVASQSGDNAVSAATSVTRSFNVSAGTAQTITFAQPADKSVADTFASGATASSGLTVTLSSSTTGICTVSGLNITAVAVGTCTIVASQSGGSSGGNTYAAATNVTRSFTVTIRPASAVLAYRIDFGTNTGVGYMNPQYAYIGSSVVLERNLYKKDGYSFAGWNTKADGSGTAYADGASFKIDSTDVILHAQWKLVQTKPTITWATPVAIQEGTALSATQLNALASVPGTYTYSPATAALLPVGKHTLKVIFVPTDPKFETIETAVEIEVLAKAKITWATPASIAEGTPLSGTQLNALGSVPGSYSYAPALGATLPVGKNTLKVTFTPSDARLSAVTAEVTIDVTAKPAVVVPPTPVEPSPNVITSKQKVYFAMSSYALDAKAKADLRSLAKKALAAGSTFKVTVVGFTQPTAKDPNFKTLANNRAKAAANFLRSLGVKGSYSITGVGQAPVNVPSSRYAEVTVIVQSK